MDIDESKRSVQEILSTADVVLENHRVTLEEKHCPKCGTQGGQLHEPGCSMEECLLCGHMHGGCTCDFPDEQSLFKAREERGRYPAIYFNTVCGQCGRVEPLDFHVDRQEWADHIGLLWRDNQVFRLCWPCYRHVVRLVQEARGRPGILGESVVFEVRPSYNTGPTDVVLREAQEKFGDAFHWEPASGEPNSPIWHRVTVPRELANDVYEAIHGGLSMQQLAFLAEQYARKQEQP